jgi:predicted RNA-binding protein (virulence factor B family)
LINLGKYNKLKVVRKSDLGYMLSDGTDEILMHFRQANGELEIGKEVTVFVYSDKEKRPCATMEEVKATISDAGFVKVIEVLPKIGVFVDNNTTKDVLISKDYLPYSDETWPQVDDTLFIRLKEKKNVLVGKPLNRFDIIELHSEFKYEDYQSVLGYVCRVNEKGIGIVTVDRVYVFVPLSQLRGVYRMGQEVNVTITKVVNGECYGTLNAHKEVLVDTDKEIILDYLKSHHGIMKLSAKSSSEEIERTLKMSRKAFKRALGSLYKERIVETDDEKTTLIKWN